MTEHAVKWLRPADLAPLDFECLNAVFKKDIKKVKFCIMAGANVNVAVYGCISGLFRAVICGNFEMAKLLVEAGADVNFNPTGKESILDALKSRSFRTRGLKVKLKHLLVKGGAHE